MTASTIERPPEAAPTTDEGDASSETWRQRIKRMTRPPRRLTFTRAGKFFMLLTLAVGAGALNTGNNLLFLLLGMMLSAIIASGILSEAVLRKLTVERRAPRRIWAGQDAQGTFTLHNPRPYLSLNIEIAERNAECIEGPAEGTWVGEQDVPFYKFWVSDAFEEARYVAMTRLFELGPHAAKSVQALYRFPTRGRYHNEGMRLMTRFPFGLFHKIVEVDDAREFLVFPRATDADDWSGEVASRFGDIARNRAGHGTEYFGLRDWREGEDRRRIHWKSSARRGEFVVRETEEQEQRAVEIVLLNATGRQAAAPERMLEDFEAGLQKTTGLLKALIAERYQVALRTFDGAVGAGEGEGHLEVMLAHLAPVTLKGGALPVLPASELPAASVRHRAVARIGVGLHAALEQCPEEFDLTLPIDQERS